MSQSARQSCSNNVPGIADNGKYLTFSLERTDYGVSLKSVRELIGMIPITHFPGAPDYMKGVINLRGRVIPIIDLRLRFGLNAEIYTERTCIVIVELSAGVDKFCAGVVVDSVSEVLTINDSKIESASKACLGLHSDCLAGIAKFEKGVKILLDVDKIVTGLDWKPIKPADQ